MRRVSLWAQVVAPSWVAATVTAVSEQGDTLPADLQPDMVDPEDYIFPNNNRRRIPGYLYLAIGVGLVAIYLLWNGSPFVNAGYLGAAIILGVFGVYSIVSGWDLLVDERDALVACIAEVGFPVGHASAQLGWRGLLSRPTWRILLYSAEEPPIKRGFVMVDGVDASIVDAFVEDNPEDWSKLDVELPPSSVSTEDTVDDSADDSGEIDE